MSPLQKAMGCLSVSSCERQVHLRRRPHPPDQRPLCPASSQISMHPPHRGLRAISTFGPLAFCYPQHVPHQHPASLRSSAILYHYLSPLTLSRLPNVPHKYNSALPKLPHHTQYPAQTYTHTRRYVHHISFLSYSPHTRSSPKPFLLSCSRTVLASPPPSFGSVWFGSLI
ncbi:hypothetical protein C8Q80DRAFT_749830 [Daedaleopsis nitida]|nr:hypothetical protein C8Q80DRAFT_749830 [Daedaleopsis nitida]